MFRTPTAPTGRSAGNVDELRREIERCAPEVLRHHVGHGDFSRWALTSLQDLALAAAIDTVEAGARLDQDTENVRARLLDAIVRRYGIEPSDNSAPGRACRQR